MNDKDENDKVKIKQPGKVWLLGAGPGDVELLTLKGKRILEKADTVVYDALVGAGILSLLPEKAHQIYVGKRGGCHAKTQEEIQDILVSQAMEGRQVVRLKGGDPFVFGRGSEEALYLRSHGISFEIIPGITSAVAVPAYCGIPVTHRGLAASFHVITGHLKNGEPMEPDYEALVRVGGTLIFLMGISSAESICEGLLLAGMAEDTPAAILQEGTTARQKKVVSTLSRLCEDGREKGMKAPAIIIIGEVCRLHELCGWSEQRALGGKKILVTRPGRRAAKMAESLRNSGAEVVELPAIDIKLLKNGKAFKEAMEKLRFQNENPGEQERYDWLAFTSPSGVELFFEYLSGVKMDVRILGGIKLAVIGRGTEAMLNRYGLYADYMPERFYARDLGEGLGMRMKAGERLLILRAKEGSQELTRELSKKQIKYEDVPLYETVFPDRGIRTEGIRQLLSNKEFDFVTFTSASTINGFMKTLNPQPEDLSGFTAVCIGEETEKSARAQGMSCIVSEIPSMEKMLEVMEHHMG